MYKRKTLKGNSIKYKREENKIQERKESKEGISIRYSMEYLMILSNVLQMHTLFPLLDKENFQRALLSTMKKRDSSHLLMISSYPFSLMQKLFPSLHNFLKGFVFNYQEENRLFPLASDI